MQKYVQYIFMFLFVACIAACGGTSNTTATAVYDRPASLAPAPASGLMGGAVQGTPLVLKDGNNNMVTTWTGVVGSAGFSNYSTANGPPARFNQPNDITTDGFDFYITDYLNNLIRKITPAGVVTTLLCTDAVTGSTVAFNRPSGITTDGTNLYVVDNGSFSIRLINISTAKVTTIGSTDGLAGSVDSTIPADVRFNQPTGITTDGENLYITDSGNNTVRRIVIATKAVSTMAGGSGAIGATDGKPQDARFYLPGRITTDGVSLYLTDVYNRTIRRIDILTGTVSTIAGSSGPLGADYGTADGIGTAAHFNKPNGITTDGTNLYVTDSFQNTIRKVVISTGAVTTIAGISKPIEDTTVGQGGHVDSPGAPSFYTPIGITTDGRGLFVVDTYNNTIRIVR